MGRPWLRATADISPCGRYRYSLVRVFPPAPDDRPRGRLLWVMLNPSTADGSRDDATLNRVAGFTHRNGFSELEVVNLFAWRARSPLDLAAAIDRVESRGPEPLGFLNSMAWGVALRRCEDVVFAWGRQPRTEVQVDRLLGIVAHTELKPKCLGLTQSGDPRHPLYMPWRAQLQPWPLPEVSDARPSPS